MKTATRFEREVLVEDTNTVEQYPTANRAKDRMSELVGQGYFICHAAYPPPHDLHVGRQVRVANPYSKEQMRAAFDKVAPSGDWKGEIDTIIEPEDLDVICEAVFYFTATEAEFSLMDGGQVRVMALGYRMGPAGDHR